MFCSAVGLIIHVPVLSYTSQINPVEVHLDCGVTIVVIDTESVFDILLFCQEAVLPSRTSSAHSNFTALTPRRLQGDQISAFDDQRVAASYQSPKCLIPNTVGDQNALMPIDGSGTPEVRSRESSMKSRRSTLDAQRHSMGASDQRQDPSLG